MTEPDSNVVSISSSPSVTLRGQISTYLINLLQTQLFPALKPAISSLLDYVIEQTNTAASNSQIMQMMEVQQKLKRSQKKMPEELQSRLIRNFEDWEQTEPSELSGFHEEDLSLVDNCVLEHKLAWQLAARQIELCDELQHLYNCESRLQSILETSPEKNPIGAQKICESFATVLSTLELDLEMTQDLMQQFAHQIKKPVNAIWVETDSYLEELGLELKSPQKASVPPADKSDSKITVSGVGERGFSATRMLSKTLGDAQADDNNVFVSSLAQEVVSKVESLMDNHPTGSSNEEPSTGICLASTDLAYALTSIQDELSSQQSCLSNLAESVKAGLATRGMANYLSPRHEDLINMVGVLFEFILDDHELPDEVKNLIGLLQIPVLKLALLEKEFLTDRQHPGRKLLNQMASAGMHCFSSDNQILRLIEETVKTIFKNFIDQPDIFAQCLESFNRELAAIEASQQEKEASSLEKTTPSSSFEELHDPVTDKSAGGNNYHGNPIDLIVQSYRLRHDIPELLADLVTIGWQQVLENAWQQELTDEDWYHHVNTMEMLLWDIPADRQQNLSAEHWETLKEYVITLLNEIDFNPLIMAEWLQAINVLTTRRLSFDDEEIVIEQACDTINEPAAECESVVNHSETEVEYQPEDSSPNTTPFIPINSLRTGQWVEFLGKNDRQLRCKLASINEETNHYVFVNESGMKVSEWSGTTLEKGIREQKIRILDNTQFFDRALHAVMENFLKF